LIIAAVLLVGPSAARGPAACAAPPADPAYAARVQQVVGSGRDVWGDALLRSRSGPTYEAARRYLRPLLLARGRHGTRLTASGVYYLAFAGALHVADGSEIVAGHVGGKSMTISVDGERYGSCLARLTGPRLYRGFYPVLETGYVTRGGEHVTQESFANGVDSYDKLSWSTGRVTYRAMPLRGPARAAPVERSTYDAARAELIHTWDRRLAGGATFDVPERRVQDAERNLLIQNLQMTWRYSLGNPYQAFEFPESLENADVLGEYGFADADRAIVRSSLTREPGLYPAWEAGSRLLAVARYVSLTGDRRFLAETAPEIACNISFLRHRQRPTGLLAPERYTADLPTVAVGLGAQATVLQGLTMMANAPSRAIAARLRPALLSAVHRSQVRLPDGSLFLPARLLDHERPYELLDRSVDGSYWNLVVPDALASGLFPPHGAEARGALAYLLHHGGRLLGLVRAGSYALYGRDGHGSGTNAVYGLNVARFLADNDEPDQLVLSLYGQLAAGMTENTFVSGEAASVTPLPGETARAMYLPPNSTSNAAFLETLRLMLVHEQGGRLELAFATPRGWLAPGKQIRVVDAPTSLGRVSYTLRSSRGRVRADLNTPASSSLRLRLPGGERMDRVTLDGRPYRRFHAGTIELTGVTGRHVVIALVR
jgi:hypothetical protein